LDVCYHIQIENIACLLITIWRFAY
jgi:hypothetical protein